MENAGERRIEPGMVAQLRQAHDKAEQSCGEIDEACDAQHLTGRPAEAELPRGNPPDHVHLQPEDDHLANQQHRVWQDSRVPLVKRREDIDIGHRLEKLGNHAEQERRRERGQADHRPGSPLVVMLPTVCLHERNLDRASVSANGAFAPSCAEAHVS